MRYVLPLLFFAMFFFGSHQPVSAQNDVPIHPTLIGKGTFLGITPPLRDLPALTTAEIATMKQNALDKAARKKEKELRLYPFAATALPKGPDAAWQQTMGKSMDSKAPIVNFEGQTTTSFPPDCNGSVGPNHFMQTVNVTYSIYNKTGTLMAGPTALNTLFTGVPGATYNDGDPIVLYDNQADRWLVAEFTFGQTNDYMLVAVSTTNDPTGTWYKYSFDVVNQPDYPKFGIWQDGYYMGINNTSGNDTYVFERSKMLLGQTAQMVAFDNSWRPGTGFLCVPPLDNDGPAAPAGSPGMFIAFNDDGVAGGSDQLWIYNLAVNWTTPASSTFTRTQQLAVTAFDSQFTSTWDDITQPTSQKLDGVPQVIMNAPQYRNFGTYQTIVCCHTVDVDATNHAGIRWYELRKTPPATTWVVRQQGTYAPDVNSRWMGSIMLNGSGKIALGYSISSSTLYPGIRYCGQSASAYASGTGVLDIAEQTIFTGTVAQTSYNRWGDYALLSVDPTDDQTFWFSTEYVKTGGTTKGSKIASFKFSNDPAVITIAASAVTGTTATLNGSVNPNGLATTYYFQWGTTVSYGSVTTTTSAGTGTTAVAVNANVTGLTGGTIYHFRLVAINSDGTAYGNDLTFSPGAAVVTTTAASSVALTTAVSGGNVTADGGLTVTARGVCWATTASPTIAASHTTDGSGLGTFTSPITGLSSNTLYHVRAYATNSSGTYYGDDLTFTTLCGIVSTFPWNEGFENGGTIPSCWTQLQVNASGINYVFITGSGNSNPAAAHGGTYDACLKDVTTADNKTMLITPTLNLGSVAGPQLKFWHTQAVWSARQDQLEVYYKTSAAGTWTLLTSYTTSLTAWTQVTISLPNPSSDYYIAFQGNAKYGRGVCIDDVEVSTSCATTVPVSVSIAASVNPVCQGSGVTFTATPTNGGTTPAYQWKVNGTSIAGATNVTYSYAPANNDAVTCVLTSNASCITGNPSTSAPVTMSVTAGVPVSVTVSPSINPVCAGTTVTFSATPVNGGNAPAYQWKVNGTNVSGATNATYSFIPANNNTVVCVLSSNAGCTAGSPASSAPVTMTVNTPAAAGISIVSSTNNVCDGTTISFTATPANGGVTPAFQWKVNGTNTGTNSPAFSYIPANGDIVTCVLTSGESCISGNPATSNPVNIVIKPILPVGVIVTPSANPECEDNLVTFTATPVNGGATPSYQWNVNGNPAGSNSPGFYTYPLNNDVVTCTLTASAGCISGNPATSAPLSMTVNPWKTLGISISASANPVCEGTSMMFTATPSNGETAPAYQWKVNGTIVPGATAATYSYTPSANDAVACILNSYGSCLTNNTANSNIINAIVNPLLPAGISIAASANPASQGTPVTFTAVPVNGGSLPAYQWIVNGANAGTNSNSYTYVPADGDAVSCILTSAESCATMNPANSNSIIMSVFSIPLTVELQNTTVTGTQCFNAFQTIVVAGNGTTFIVPDGAYATMVAGQNIRYYPGTVVEQGGYLYAYIAPEGPWCMAPAIATAADGTGKPQQETEQQFYRIYPNPTSGVFMLELNASYASEKCLIEIYDMKGGKMFSTELTGEQKHEFSLSGKPIGIYLVRVISEKNSGTTRIIKQ
ncbi:MAG: choice-of-anchor J domain-containing protein [Bacteroidetes bacterium]|nr:choice-of-anchor J domain-containing protein [Bacteroidota bacterium]